MPPLHYLPIGIFAVVYILIALRNFRRFKIPIWTIMLAGAVAMIFSGAIPLQDAYAAINLDVIFFLLGMFSIVAAMELSGLLEYLMSRLVMLIIVSLYLRAVLARCVVPNYFVQATDRYVLTLLYECSTV